MSGDDHGDTTQTHEFDEDVADGSMCTCGIPALYHHLVGDESMAEVSR